MDLAVTSHLSMASCVDRTVFGPASRHFMDAALLNGQRYLYGKQHHRSNRHLAAALMGTTVGVGTLLWTAFSATVYLLYVKYQSMTGDSWVFGSGLIRADKLMNKIANDKKFRYALKDLS